MKETIEYYYNIEIEDLEEYDGKYHFKFNNQDYFFVFYNRREEELEDIINVIREMISKGINVNEVLVNRNGSYLTKVGEYNYILFRVSNIYYEYDIFDMDSMSKKLVLNNNVSSLYRNNWGKLWSQKIDYFEMQVRELGLELEVIKNSFSYYIGLAENAISYVNNANLKNREEYKITLAHRRVFYPNYKLNYLNPLSFVFDLRVRDIAEYLKSMFFKEGFSYTLEELRTYLKIAHLSLYECEMLYARMLYPTYYFDLYDEVINKGMDEDMLINVIKNSSLFEEFLGCVYIEIKKYADIDRVDWLVTKH